MLLFIHTCSVIFLRGSLGFGEEALQSLPGKIGSQVLTITTSCNLNFAYSNVPLLHKTALCHDNVIIASVPGNTLLFCLLHAGCQ